MIRARGLAKDYGEKHVLRGLDFELERGGFLVVTGANGSGKTTLITPFIVKNAVSSLRRSPGRTRECSYASSSATAATPSQ